MDFKEQVLSVVKNKKFQIIATIFLLLVIVLIGANIRTQNLESLKDVTTGEYIPLALDPFYFLRVSETIVANDGLPALDVMRSPALGISWHTEILPHVVVGIYKIANTFNSEITLRYINVLSPVIFFVMSIILFFFLCYFLIKSKIAAILGAAFLALIPSYLYRTMAGFSDHEAIGMVSFFAALLVGAMAIKYLGKSKLIWRKIILWGIGVGALSALTVSSWGGVSNFLFMIIPLSFLILWLVKIRTEEGKSFGIKGFSFYLIWIVSTIVIGLILGNSYGYLLSKFISSNGIVSFFVLGFCLVDLLIVFNLRKLGFIRKKYRQIYSLLAAFILGVFALIVSGRGFISLIKDIWIRIFQPWGTERVALTVAENAQPYLNDWIAQGGQTIFWMFFAAIIFFGFEISRGIRSMKGKISFNLAWIFLVSGILFSRISSASLFNGVNFISQAFYLLAVLVFIFVSAWVYFNEEIKIKPEMIFIASWMIFTLISARAATRMFFAITPFVCFSAGYLLIVLFKYYQRSSEEFLKLMTGILLILVLISSIVSLIGAYNLTMNQAKFTTPSANQQWQKAMEWVRTDTPADSIFLHWWDYGYWVQTLGERATVADGGHSEGAFGDHTIGRYVLTTDRPETALSFMKTWDATHLLIDPTDIGKYGAYSKIGSGPDGTDRFSWIPSMISDPSEIQETRDSQIRLYRGGGFIDEDILYQTNEGQVFLPEGKAAIAGASVRIGENEISQPIGIFVYNNQQIEIPLRYAYYEENLVDFGGGLEAAIRIIPRVSANSANTGYDFDTEGALIYLSPKTMKSLVVQLYILNDAFDKYPTLKIAHSQPDPSVEFFNSQGAGIKDLVYFRGINGPIKIWKISIPGNIVEVPEFLKTSGEWGELDDSKFSK
jgi:asparagine N-glycosylation enzyme membrane subunit Stt3